MNDNNTNLKNHGRSPKSCSLIGWVVATVQRGMESGGLWLVEKVRAIWKGRGYWGSQECSQVLNSATDCLLRKTITKTELKMNVNAEFYDTTVYNRIFFFFDKTLKLVTNLTWAPCWVKLNSPDFSQEPRLQSHSGLNHPMQTLVKRRNRRIRQSTQE